MAFIVTRVPTTEAAATEQFLAVALMAKTLNWHEHAAPLASRAW
jgi:hypothetical protein